MAKKAKKAVKKAVKKTVKRAVKKVSKPKAAKAVKRSQGRPTGATNFYTDTIAVKESVDFTKARAVETFPGLRRIVVEVSTPEYALHLEALAKLIDKSPDKLVSYLKRMK